MDPEQKHRPAHGAIIKMGYTGRCKSSKEEDGAAAGAGAGGARGDIEGPVTPSRGRGLGNEEGAHKFWCQAVPSSGAKLCQAEGAKQHTSSGAKLYTSLGAKLHTSSGAKRCQVVPSCSSQMDQTQLELVHMDVVNCISFFICHCVACVDMSTGV